MLYAKEHLYEALLRWNYFPNQKKGLSELPPTFTSRQLTPDIADILTNEVSMRKGGYGIVEYKSTRFNNVPRLLGIVHPTAHTHLSKVLYENWEEYYHIYTNNNSIVRPEAHADGRAFIMNYEDYEEKVSRSLKTTFGKKFRAHTDISNCFNSIYTHSVEWALRGLEETKINLSLKPKNRTKHWSEDLDIKARSSKRNETQGIPIGPGTSSVIVEIILAKIDNKLAEKYDFDRYVDDYTCLCDSHEQAQEFIRDLSLELNNFKLSLNLTKTSIVELPEPLQPAWVSDLVKSRPNFFIDNNYGTRKITLSEAIHFLDYAVRKNKQTPDGSVIKFAISSIIKHIHEDDTITIADYILNLSWHYPLLLPFLDEMDINEENLAHFDLKEKLIKIINNNAHYKRSDGIAWPLYYLRKYNLEIENHVSEKIIESRDCVSICMLIDHNESLPLALHFARQITELSEFQKDEYWLLLYQLFLKGEIENPYENDRTFSILKEHSVNFMPPTTEQTFAETFTVYKMFNAEGELTYLEHFNKQKEQ
ncbi:antiviral reverse transcriptase Drt4 [Halomonas hibernica]|uniref:antiviral reverse transcriptase Drt4 n=1 Tax=Halomonas hibernica TaxID=2591147 RepID=UPI001556F4AE|nr:antiviral reverse transcriptase Drt4 [Halomonas hibernica]